jgi:dihydroflavonol-4-reductase
VSRRVAVTGASGFIGRHVVGALNARGDLAIPVRRPFESTLTETFRGVDAVVHLAGVVSAVHERDYWIGNVDATRTVATAAAAAGIRMVHISSLAAAGPAPASAPRTEDDPPAPITTYGRTKLEGERVLLSIAGLESIILRPGVVYGPGDRAMRPLFRFARAGFMPLVGSPSAAYTFIYIDDATRAILAALDRRSSGGVVFLGHAEPVSPGQLLQAIRETVGSSGRIVAIPRPAIRAAALAGDLWGNLTGRPTLIDTRRFAELYSEGFVCRVDRMRERLGEARVDLREGLARASSWYLS